MSHQTCPVCAGMHYGDGAYCYDHNPDRECSTPHLLVAILMELRKGAEERADLRREIRELKEQR